MEHPPLKVLCVSSEVAPFAKSGGLADVAGALPGALNGLGAEVRVVMPFYGICRSGGFGVRRAVAGLRAPLGGDTVDADVMEAVTGEGVPVYLVEREDLYDRPHLYGDGRGDYYDNLERFAFLCHAALRLVDAVSFRPDVIHCHDWQTGLIPALLRGTYGTAPSLRGASTVFTIHNVGYQGLFPERSWTSTGLARDEFYHQEGLEYWGGMSLLKAGIVYADAITTVSPTYARQILTAEYGMGMEGILRRRSASLRGILNGVDYRVWDPARDPLVPVRYGPGDRKGKRRCKEALMEECGFDAGSAERPVVGIVSRLDAQKGFDLFLEILDEVVALGPCVVVLGAGNERIETGLRAAAARHPGRVAVTVGFDEGLAHRIMAGADMALVPSKYEPCGLTQLYALKYGTVPVVRGTGGLADTVTPFDSPAGSGTGFVFDSYDARAFLGAVGRAVEVYGTPRTWNKIVTRGMKADFSWERSARAYLELFRSLVGGKREER